MKSSYHQVPIEPTYVWNIRNFSVSKLHRSALVDLLLCVSIGLRTSAQIQTFTIFLMAYLCSWFFYFPAYLRTVPSSTLRTSHFAFCSAVNPRTVSSLALHTPALTLWITYEPLIRAKLTVQQCTTDCQIHRSDHAPKRSHPINRFALQFTDFTLI